MSTMIVLIDGKEVECETIELIEEGLIIGCTCAGGSHQEIKGSSRITIENGEFTAEMLDSEGESEYTSIINLSEMFEDMTKSVIRMRHKHDNKEYYESFEHIF